MQQNTPMKRQFTTIDGRTVMSNLPQHWGGDDWKITGVDNPLPVGNYIQTDSGVWIPQKGSDDGAVDVRLTGRNVEELVKRSVRNSGFINNILKMPQYAKNVTFTVSVYGVTRTFADGEGLAFRIIELASAPYHVRRQITWTETSSHANVGIIVLSTFAKPSETTPGVREFISLDRPLLTNILRWDLLINGEFGVGEGFDVEVYAHW